MLVKKISEKEWEFWRREYRLPPDIPVVDVERRECRYVGGGAVIVVVTADGQEHWWGCGHHRCSGCRYGAGNLVGDEAYKFYGPAHYRGLSLKECQRIDWDIYTERTEE